MSLFKSWGKALAQILRTADRLPAKRKVMPVSHPVAASRAREMLERIRRGEYEFSGQEISDILKKNNWLGRRQPWFVSLAVTGESLADVHLRLPWFGNLSIQFLIQDLWHDQRVSSLDFQIRNLSLASINKLPLKRFWEKIFVNLLYLALRWNGSWRHESLRFVLRTGKTVRLYFEWPTKKTPLLENISVIGARIQKNCVIFYTFRRLPESTRDFGLALSGAYVPTQPTTMSRLAVVFSWILLGVYAFVLVHVTLPVLGGAFQLMPQDATAVHIWVLTQVYNLCVILLSYFFLRITMLPLYLKWNKSKEDLATLISLEERDHQYLRPLTELVKKMQLAGKEHGGRGPTGSVNSLTTQTIAQMIELMSSIREQSRHRLLGMTRMRRGWVQDLLIGYLFIFSLEWMYYKGLLTPLSVSIKWVNRIMVGLFLLE